MSDYDKKIESALSTDKKTYQAMKKDIENLSNIKSDAEKAKAISAYQKKYLNAYNTALKKANVDLNDIVKTLKKMYPNYDIAQKNNAIHFKSSSKSNPPTNLNTDKTEIVRLNDFVETSDVSCGLGAGGDVKHTANSVETTSIAVVAGGCRNTGKKVIEYKVPKNVKSAILKIKGKLFTEGFAVGVLGVSTSLNSASFTYSGIINSIVFAPILWVGYDFSELTLNSEIEFTSGENIRLSGYSHSSSVSLVCCETHGKAKVSDIDAKVYLKR